MRAYLFFDFELAIESLHGALFIFLIFDNKFFLYSNLSIFSLQITIALRHQEVKIKSFCNIQGEGGKNILFVKFRSACTMVLPS